MRRKQQIGILIILLGIWIGITSTISEKNGRILFLGICLFTLVAYMFGRQWESIITQIEEFNCTEIIKIGYSILIVAESVILLVFFIILVLVTLGIS